MTITVMTTKRTHIPEDGGNTVIRNVGIQPPHCTVKQSRKPLIRT